MTTTHARRMLQLKTALTIVTIASFIAGIIFLIGFMQSENYKSMLIAGVNQQPVWNRDRNRFEVLTASQKTKLAEDAPQLDALAQLMLPVGILLAAIFYVTTLGSIWCEWYCWLIFVAVLYGLNLLFYIATIHLNPALSVGMITVNALLLTGFAFLALLVKLKWRQPHLFGLQGSSSSTGSSGHGPVRGFDYSCAPL